MTHRLSHRLQFIGYNRNLSSHIDLHTRIYAGNASDNRVTLTFDLLTSGSTHAIRYLSVCMYAEFLPRLVLVAQAACI